MPLIVETGQGLPNADSYVSLEDGRATAAKYGLELPEDDTKAEAALRNGAVYVGLFESQSAVAVYRRTRRWRSREQVLPCTDSRSRLTLYRRQLSKLR
ncbi:hypothetical protein [Salmonella phage CKT1]|nr:hypothetical protein [Salmonella phage CKT1]